MHPAEASTWAGERCKGGRRKEAFALALQLSPVFPALTLGGAELGSQCRPHSPPQACHPPHPSPLPHSLPAAAHPNLPCRGPSPCCSPRGHEAASRGPHRLEQQGCLTWVCRQSCTISISFVTFMFGVLVSTITKRPVARDRLSPMRTQSQQNLSKVNSAAHSTNRAPR